MCMHLVVKFLKVYVMYCIQYSMRNTLPHNCHGNVVAKQIYHTIHCQNANFESWKNWTILHVLTYSWNKISGLTIILLVGQPFWNNTCEHFHFNKPVFIEHNHTEGITEGSFTSLIYRHFWHSELQHWTHVPGKERYQNFYKNYKKTN